MVIGSGLGRTGDSRPFSGTRPAVILLLATAAPLAKLIARIIAEDDENRPYSYLELGCGTGLCWLTGAEASVKAASVLADRHLRNVARVHRRGGRRSELDGPDAAFRRDSSRRAAAASRCAAAERRLRHRRSRDCVCCACGRGPHGWLCANTRRRPRPQHARDLPRGARGATEGRGRRWRCVLCRRGRGRSSCVRRARLLLLDTSEGAPVDFCI